VAGTFARSLWSFPLDSLLPSILDTVANGLTPLSSFKTQAFPNPFQSILELQSNAAIRRIAVYDLAGEIVAELKPDQKLSLSTADWSTGTYVVQWTNSAGQTQTEVVLKQ
jgi:hypothetical protein